MPDALEAQLLRKATSVGPDWSGRENLTLGTMPLPSPQNLTSGFLEGSKGLPGRLADLLLSRALGKMRDRMPPLDDIAPRLANHFLPPGQHYPLSTDPKKP